MNHSLSMNYEQIKIDIFRKKTQKNNKILEISMYELCSEYKIREVQTKRAIPVKKTQKILIKREVKIEEIGAKLN